MMFSPRIVCTFTALLAPVAFAQSAQVPGDSTQQVAHLSLRDADSQQRRAMLRASLRSQPENLLARETATAASRMMSDQKRADLRQQLRHQ
nr:hypothetical protein [uncultured Rhodoferax sp.]